MKIVHKLNIVTVGKLDFVVLIVIGWVVDIVMIVTQCTYETQV